MSGEALALQGGIQVVYEGRPCVVFAVDARTVTLKGLTALQRHGADWQDAGR